jgi:hypothetical protein
MLTVKIITSTHCLLCSLEMTFLSENREELASLYFNLLTEGEMMLGEASWKALSDPFPDWQNHDTTELEAS